jgi:hypothetical protein
VGPVQNVFTTNATCVGPFEEIVMDAGRGWHVMVTDDVVQLNVTVPFVPGTAVITPPTGSMPPGGTGPNVPLGGGVIVIVIGEFETVSCAVPTIFPSVAVIVTGPPKPTPVANPVAAPIDATSVLEEIQCDCAVTSLVELSENVPVAVNCCVPFTAIVTGFGVTAIDFSVTLLPVTVSCAVPVTVPSVAVIVMGPPGALPPVAKPVFAPIVAVSVSDDVQFDWAVTSFVD